MSLIEPARVDNSRKIRVRFRLFQFEESREEAVNSISSTYEHSLLGSFPALENTHLIMAISPRSAGPLPEKGTFRVNRRPIKAAIKTVNFHRNSAKTFPKR
jgi:hypothetical protein